MCWIKKVEGDGKGKANIYCVFSEVGIMISALKVRKLRTGKIKLAQAHKANPEFTPTRSMSHLLHRLSSELYKKEFYIERGISL